MRQRSCGEPWQAVGQGSQSFSIIKIHCINLWKFQRIINKSGCLKEKITESINLDGKNCPLIRLTSHLVFISTRNALINNMIIISHCNFATKNVIKISLPYCKCSRYLKIHFPVVTPKVWVFKFSSRQDYLRKHAFCFFWKIVFNRQQPLSITHLLSVPAFTLKNKVK